MVAVTRVAALRTAIAAADTAVVAEAASMVVEAAVTAVAVGTSNQNSLVCGFRLTAED